MTEQHRHYWIRDEHAEPGTAYACRDCEETCEACFRCDRWTSSSLLICDGCLTRIRRLLDLLDRSLDLYEPQPRSIIPAIRYDRDRIRGTFSEDHDPLRWTVHDVPGILAGWAQMWAEESGQPLLIDAIPYLKGHLLWAAHNREAADWDQWMHEMGKALAVAKAAAGVAPKRLTSPCVHCGGVAVQDWADEDLTPFDTGLDDLVRCLGCRLTWSSAAHFGQASKQHLRDLPVKDPDVIVTLTEAALVWPDVPAATWRKWAQRAELPVVAAWDERGVAQYRVGDLEALALRRVDTTRRGRRAG